MRGLKTSVVKLRREVFREVARVAFDAEPEKVNDAVEAIPYKITPTEEPRFRENIYRERAIAAEQVRLAMGMSLRPADKPVHITAGIDQSDISDKYYEPPLMQVIPSACDKCPDNVYEVSNQCRQCVAKACVAACPKNAITVVDGKTVMLDSGKPLEYMPFELKLNLTGSPYVKTAGARMAKYEVDRTAHSDGRQPDNDIVLFRYADVLLMQAEAKVRNGEDGTQELNTVRSRVGMPYRKATLDNILKERLLELVWEGWRRQDLIRYGLYHLSYDQREQLPGESTGYTTVFPIPQKCIDLNPRLEQHVGYE